MAERMRIDVEAWEDHAKWWDAEAPAARARMAVDDTALQSARAGFGKIGSSTVGAAYADALSARHALGQRLGDYAQDVAARIRANLADYRAAEDTNSRSLGS
jgi:hypothetical protein